MAFKFTAGGEPPPPLLYSLGQQQQLPPLPPPQSGLCSYDELTSGGNTELSPVVTAGYRNFGFGMDNDYLKHGVGHSSGYYGQGFGWADNFPCFPNSHAKPGADFSGTKRKAVSPVEVSAKQLFSVGNTKRKGVWRCDICEVSTTSERGLNEHVQGKKHRAKEAAVKKKNCNIDLGVLPKKKLKPVIEVTHCVNMEQGLKLGTEASQIGQSEPSSLHDVSTQYLDASSASLLPENAKNKKPKKVKLQKAPKSKPKEKNNFLFWCDICQVGTKNEKVMEGHRKGKKHRRLCQKAVEKGQGISVPRTMVSQGEDNGCEAAKEGTQASYNVDYRK